jgi:hypothetical protein
MTAIVAGLAVLLAMSTARQLTAQISGTGPVLGNTSPPPFGEEIWADGGFPISWEQTNCPVTSSIVVHTPGHTYHTLWSRTSGTGIGYGTYVPSGGSYVVSDDKTKRLVNPVLTVYCINIQWTTTVVATISWVVSVDDVVSNTGTEEDVPRPTAKFLLTGPGGSGTDIVAIIPAGTVARINLDASSSSASPGGPSISSFDWLLGGYPESFENQAFNFIATNSINLTVTDSDGVTGQASGSVTIDNADACDDPMTHGVEDCSDLDPGATTSYEGGSSEPDTYQGQNGGQVYVCYVTDWYEWNGSSWFYSGTDVDYCGFENK